MAFEQLAEPVQRWVWSQGWKALRPIQEQAIPVILQGNRDVILSSPTASGKTEAAFLPILSNLLTGGTEPPDRSTSFDVVCVSPLKALINDQFERLNALGEACGIKVHKWHGDVSQHAKRAALASPEGILLVTPESLEALFLRKGPAFHAALRHLRYLVVDELHAFVGTPRGRQLQSLLHRAETVAGRRVPRVALSATIGDPSLAADALRPGFGREVVVLQPPEATHEIHLLVRGYEAGSQNKGAHDDGVEESGATDGSVVAIAERIHAEFRGHKNLLFANRRQDVELLVDHLAQLAERDRVPMEFHPHHGSLAKDIREGTEALLNSAQPATAVCTNTLELGIDIGRVHSIGQFGPPPSVASMRQRLGRSGRRGEPSILRVYIQERHVTEHTPLQDTLRPGLVQTVAMVRLLLSGWHEPPVAGALELSTALQQTLSVIAEHGGIHAAGAYELLCKRGPFNDLSVDDYLSLLRSLARHDLISQAGDGTLIMGLAGERLIDDFDFYAAFWSPEEYRLATEEKSLGTLPITSPLVEGQLLVFGGRRWRVREIRARERVVFLAPAGGGKPPIFSGEGADVHDRVRQEMLAVYQRADVPTYLDATARNLLDEGRLHFRHLGLADRSVVEEGGDSIAFIWAGDRIINTIRLLLASRGMMVAKSAMTLYVKDSSSQELYGHFRASHEDNSLDSLAMAGQVPDKIIDKHDSYLDEPLLIRNFASKRIDFEGARAYLGGLLRREETGRAS